MKKIVLKTKQKFLPMLFSSDDMVKWLRINGVAIGVGCRFYRPSSMLIDINKPASLQIGNYVKITSHVKILAHDYSYSVLRRTYGDLIDKYAVTVIGDNVFIGVNSVILPGAHIGNNVIIGAGSVVSGNISDNVVIAGNPAKVIRSLQEHYEYAKNHLKDDAKKQYLLLKDYYGRRPTPREMGNYYPLYTIRNLELIHKEGLRTNLGGDNESEFIEWLMQSAPEFADYDSFCEWVELDNANMEGEHEREK